MNEDELELAILQKYVAQYRIAGIANSESSDKCARELDMREVIRVLTNEEGNVLENTTKFWYGRLVSPIPRRSKFPLRSCGDSKINNDTHKYYARAFNNRGSTSAWDRVEELEVKISEREARLHTIKMSEKIEKVTGRHQTAKGKLNEFVVVEYFQSLGYKAEKTSTKLDQMKIDVVAESSNQLVHTQVKLGQISNREMEKVIKSALQIKTRSKKLRIVAFVAERFPSNAEIIRQEFERLYSLPIWHIHAYQVLEALPEYKSIIGSVDI